MKTCIYVFVLLTGLCASKAGMAQQPKVFDLQKMLSENKLETYGQKLVPIQDGNKRGVSANKVIWLKGVSFSNGTIEIDLRGKDIPQQSFLGVAFHGVDTTTYDAIYFRPFNFRSKDSIRKIHAVQYISHPIHTWSKLREEHPGMYEKGITPPPLGTDWFHARIEIKNGVVKVFVNNATTPSLTVTKLNNRKEGLLGLWNFALNGDFANLVVQNN